MDTILKKEIIVNKAACRLIGVTAFIIFTVLGAFVRLPLPFTPVPITLQTFFVLLSGALLGSRLGAVTQISYIFLGVIGLPVFTQAGAGYLYLFGPTGGYVFGFLIAAFLLGAVLKSFKGNKFILILTFIAADFIILVFGAIWLKLFLGCNLAEAFLMGFLPFVPADMLKALVACQVYLTLKSRAKEIF